MIPAMSIFRPLLMCASLCLGACSGESGGGTPTGPHLHKNKSARAEKPGPTREEQTAGMVSAASPPRSAEIAELKFDIAARPEAGKPLEVQLALLPLTEAPSASLELSGSDGLTLPADQAVVNFNDIGRTHVYRSRVSVTPAAEGIYFLTAVVAFKNPDFTDTRSFTVPIIVAAAGTAPPPRNLKDAKEGKEAKDGGGGKDLKDVKEREDGKAGAPPPASVRAQ